MRRHLLDVSNYDLGSLLGVVARTEDQDLDVKGLCVVVGQPGKDDFAVRVSSPDLGYTLDFQLLRCGEIMVELFLSHDWRGPQSMTV